MSIQTPRHKLPLLAVGQAQKEYVHNEALLLIDTIMNLSVQGISNNPIFIDQAENDVSSPPLQSWLIGDQPTGIWQQRSNHIATWTRSGWRYLAPIEGMQIYHQELKCCIIFDGSQWDVPDSLEISAQGANIDQEARQSIQSVINILQKFGLSRE